MIPVFFPFCSHYISAKDSFFFPSEKTNVCSSICFYKFLDIMGVLAYDKNMNKDHNLINFLQKQSTSNMINDEGKQ